MCISPSSFQPLYVKALDCLGKVVEKILLVDVIFERREFCLSHGTACGVSVIDRHRQGEADVLVEAVSHLRCP